MESYSHDHRDLQLYVSSVNLYEPNGIVGIISLVLALICSAEYQTVGSVRLSLSAVPHSIGPIDMD